MKIKHTGLIVTDDEGNETVLYQRTEEAKDETVDNFFREWGIEKHTRERNMREKPERPTEVEAHVIEGIHKEEGVVPEHVKPKRVKAERVAKAGRKKSLPSAGKRQTRILGDMSEEFEVKDIADLFEKDGYVRSDVTKAAYGDLRTLARNQKIEYIEGSKPARYRIVSRK